MRDVAFRFGSLARRRSASAKDEECFHVEAGSAPTGSPNVFDRAGGKRRACIVRCHCVLIRVTRLLNSLSSASTSASTIASTKAARPCVLPARYALRNNNERTIYFAWPHVYLRKGEFT